VAAAIARWAAPRQADGVRIDGAPSTGLVGANGPTIGVTVRLEELGAAVRPSSRFHLEVGTAATAGSDGATWLVLIANTDGSSVGPAPGQQVLVRHGSLQAYVSRVRH
jgi:hypothetical protein